MRLKRQSNFVNNIGSRCDQGDNASFQESKIHSEYSSIDWQSNVRCACRMITELRDLLIIAQQHAGANEADFIIARPRFCFVDIFERLTVISPSGQSAEWSLRTVTRHHVARQSC